MKTTAGTISLTAAALLAALSLNLGAQIRSTSAARIERMALLPGPELLSPARGAPQSTPAITITPPEAMKLGHAPAFYFSPRGEWRFIPSAGERPSGVFFLGSAKPGSAAVSTDVKHAGGLTLGDPLKFDAKLPPGKPLKLQQQAR